MKSNRMAWLKSNWRWLSLNLFAASMLVIVTTQGSLDINSHTFDPELESGKWAVRFLLTSLAVTPLNTYLNWTSVIKLRKTAGLWACTFAVLHVAFLIADRGLEWLVAPLVSPMQLYLVLGLFGLAVLVALAITSNRWAMRRLAKGWKRLHKLVYPASLAITGHSILATLASKKLMFRDPRSAEELKIYLGVLVVLLVVRLPQVRRMVKAVAALGRQTRQPDLPINPVIVPMRQPEYVPRIYASGREVAVNEFSGKFPLAPEVENGGEDGSEPMDLPLALD